MMEQSRSNTAARWNGQLSRIAVISIISTFSRRFTELSERDHGKFSQDLPAEKDSLEEGNWWD